MRETETHGDKKISFRAIVMLILLQVTGRTFDNNYNKAMIIIVMMIVVMIIIIIIKAI